MENTEAPDSGVDSSERLPNPPGVHSGQWPGNNVHDKEAENNSRKRKLDEDSNDEDVISVKSGTVRSAASADFDMRQTYGLKYGFLRSLGIHPPIDKWVSVSNFRCDKSELKDVLELAGHVIVCSVITIRNRYAKVMYSHPLEAVQAVSMLHGQMFYGLKLHVIMIPSLENSLVLPKGLEKIGPGLGIGGLPLRDVVQHFKKYLKRKNTLVDKRIFCSADKIKDELLVENEENDANQTDEFLLGRWINPFKLIPVQEIPDGNDAVSVNDSETDSKKAKRDADENSVNSDHGSENGNEKQHNAPDGKNKPFDRGFRITTSPETSPIPTLNSNQAHSRRNPSPPHMGQGSHSPDVNRYGMGDNMQLRFLPNSRGPFVPSVRPMGHPNNTNMCSPTRPLGPPINNMGMPVRSALGPPNSGPQNRFPGPITGPSGPPAAMTNMRAPAAHMRTASVPLNIGNYAYFSPNRPFQEGSPSPHLLPMMGGGSPILTSGEVGLRFTNLPPSTTFSLLCEKVSQCGQVVSLQLTTPRCALVIFANKQHADRCYQLLNRAFIDGCQICVSYA